MKDLILERINKLGGRGISFAELSDIEGFEGELAMLVAGNTILWTGMSNQAIDAMRELLDEGVIDFYKTSSMIYAIDGNMLTLPLAKNHTYRYKKHRWLPVTMTLREYRPIGIGRRDRVQM